VEAQGAILTAARAQAAHAQPVTLALASTPVSVRLVLQAVPRALTTFVDHATLDIP
jgi:hypothetical protein